MKTTGLDWRSLLRSTLDHGAGAEAETLPLEDMLAMRRTVVEAARERSAGGRRSRSLALVAAVIVLTGVGAAVIGRRFETREPAAPGPAAWIHAAGGEQLQLQFATPGGTRIIWVFNADLDLKAAGR